VRFRSHRGRQVNGVFGFDMVSHFEILTLKVSVALRSRISFSCADGASIYCAKSWESKRSNIWDE
jgi:hypothetical protein